MKSKTVTAQIDNLEEVMNFIDQFLVDLTCPEKIKDQIRISVEEIFTNIASYAYPGQPEGKVKVACEIAEEGRKEYLKIRFQDWGIPYNPLKRPEPDFDIPFEERGIGGLGIHMVRKFMDDVEYVFEEGCNQLLIQKVL